MKKKGKNVGTTVPDIPDSGHCWSPRELDINQKERNTEIDEIWVNEKQAKRNQGLKLFEKSGTFTENNLLSSQVPGDGLNGAA